MTSPGPRRARRLVAVPLVGALLGVLVGGVLGRSVMHVLVRLSPEASGRLSDDGFEMGRFTLSGSVNLLIVAGALGLVGGLVHLLVRPLLLGPGWFRVGAVGLASGVGVGNLLVHTDGVDFTLLQPAWLSVAAFVALPALYGVLLALVVEGRLLASWPVPPAGPPALSAALWLGRVVALGVGLVSVVRLVDKLTVLV